MEQQDLIRVLIVDDHQVVRSGLRFYLATCTDVEVVGEASGGQQALELCDQLQPDVVMVDMIMPDMDGTATTRAIRNQHPAIQILVMSGYAEGSYIQEALKAGAVGYLFKDAGASEVIHAVRAAFNGLSALTPRAVKTLLEEQSAPIEHISPLSEENFHLHEGAKEVNGGNSAITTDAPTSNSPQTELDVYYSLTHRERQILKLVLLGFTSAEIGYRLYISPRTAEKHRANMMHKLGVHNQIELSRLAHRLNIMPDEDETTSNHPQGDHKLDFISFQVRDRGDNP